MSDSMNRTLIILVAALWIVLMAVVIFLTWTADADVIDRLGDAVEYMDEHNDDAGRLIATLGALLLAVLAVLVLIVEIAPEGQVRELRVEQAGATTIVPAEVVRLRLEEALLALPNVTAAKARVEARSRGIATTLDVTVAPHTNVGMVTQEAARVVVDTIQIDLGLPVDGVPTVRVALTAAPAQPHAPAAPPPAQVAHPAPERPPAMPTAAGTVDERTEIVRPATPPEPPADSMPETPAEHGGES